MRNREKALDSLVGGMPDVVRMKVIEQFGNEKSALRVIVATDVASEGINLHYLSHRLIHFDIPWSLMALQQRNGRIDRYGQESQPQIRYMLTRSVNERVDEAERIIRILVDKDEQAVKNIGDPSVFMGVFDIDEEMLVTSQAIEGIGSGETAESYDNKLKPDSGDDDEDDLFADLFGDAEVSEEPQARDKMRQMPSLFRDDFNYTRVALKAVNEENPLQLKFVEEESLIEFTVPEELKRRFKRLPKEILPVAKEPLRLCGDKTLVMEEFEETRKSENEWSTLQYLWELHPVVYWINDRGLTLFGRHQAPVIGLNELNTGEVVFVMLGVIPNRRGQPLINKWVSVIFQNGKFERIEDFEETLERTSLGKLDISNRMQSIDEKLNNLRGIAVKKAENKMIKERNDFENRINIELQEQYDRLGKLKSQHRQQLELRYADGTPVVNQRKSREEIRVERIFAEYFKWIEDSMSTDPVPYIKIIAVLQGEG